jgi:lysophospholipase L1-like esterase
MLETSVDHAGWILPAKVSGLTQIFYQHELTDASLIAVVIICTRAGRYAISFNGWGEELTFAEKGIYFMDNRNYGGGKYAAMMTCTVTSVSEETEESPVEYNGNEIQVFNRGLCIGDSITEGVFNHNDGETVIKKYSYPSFLKRITGIDIVNAGVAGLTSKTWYNASLDSGTKWGRWVNDEWVWSESPNVGESDKVSTALDYSGYDFAIIHLGINDIGMMGDATLDATISTFETNINNIINKLKTANTGIKVFLATIIPCYAVPGSTAYEAINEKIREIANVTDDVFLIDLNMYSECFDGTPYENQHLTAPGYHKMASEIAAYISYIISQNLEDFKWVQFIGTSYTG